jgi:hypothetical protein
MLLHKIFLCSKQSLTLKWKIWLKMSIFSLIFLLVQILWHFTFSYRGQESHDFHPGFILATIVLCFLYRFLGTFILSALVNLGRIQKIEMKEQIIMGYGGLRGAVGFSLAVVLSQVSGKRPLIGCWAITGRKPPDSDCSPIYGPVFWAQKDVDVKMQEQSLAGWPELSRIIFIYRFVFSYYFSSCSSQRPAYGYFDSPAGSLPGNGHK